MENVSAIIDGQMNFGRFGVKFEMSVGMVWLHKTVIDQRRAGGVAHSRL